MRTRTGVSVGVGMIIAGLLAGAGAGCAAKKEEVRAEPQSPVQTSAPPAESPAETQAAAEAGALGIAEATAFCVRLHENAAQCPNEFTALLLDLRAALDPRFAGVLARKGVRESMMAEGVKEVLADGTGPLEPRQAKCREYAANGPPVPAGDPQTLEPCYAMTACDAKMACMKPVLEQRFLDRARGGSTAEPQPQ